MNTDHLNTWKIWIPNFMKFTFQMVGLCAVFCSRPIIWILDQYLRKQNGIDLSGTQMAVKYQTIWYPISFPPFE